MKKAPVRLARPTARYFINLKEKFRSSEKIAIEPVRIGMPGTKEEGIVFGPPKRDTPYPIDRVKVINEKGKTYVEFFSSRARGLGREKPITYVELTPRALMVVPQPGLPASSCAPCGRYSGSICRR